MSYQRQVPGRADIQGWSSSSQGYARDVEINARKPSGASLESAAKDPNTWMNILQIVMFVGLFLLFGVLLILYLVWVVPLPGKVDSLEGTLAVIRQQNTPGMCWSGCESATPVCAVDGDCTPLLVQDGTMSSAACLPSKCVFYTLPAAFPVSGEALAENLCFQTLNMTDPRLPCLKMSVVMLSDMATGCQFINNCGTFDAPPVILRDIPSTETVASVSTDDAPEDSGSPKPAARSSTRRVIRK
mgnify:FL=1